MLRITALYANVPGSRFDGDYYVEKHAPFARALLAPHGLIDLRITLGKEKLDGGDPPFWSISEMTFSSRDAFDAAIAASGAELFADVPNYTDCTPVLQISELRD